MLGWLEDKYRGGDDKTRLFLILVVGIVMGVIWAAGGSR